MNTMENNSTNASVSASPDLLLVRENLLITAVLSVALGVPLNLLVLVLITTGALVKVCEIPALNQTLCELGICVGRVLFIVQLYAPNEHLPPAVRFFFGMMLGRLLFMTLMCVTCYVAAVHPVAFLRFKPRRNQLAMAGACWLTVLVACTAYLGTTWGQPSSPEDYLVIPWTLAIVETTLASVCIVGQLICCVQVLRRLVQPAPGERRPGRRGVDGTNLRAFAIICALLVSALNCLPYVVVISMEKVLSRAEFALGAVVTDYMGVVGGLMLPILWVFRAEKLPCTRAP